MPVNLRQIADLVSSDIKAAIVITESGPNQHHVGIAFIEADESTYSLAHLPFHHRALRGSLTARYYWAELRLNRARRLQIAARCREILASNPEGLPYAFSPPNDCFDKETGKSLLGPSGSGLTCATFVLAVFDSIGLPLVKWETWPYRAKDILWQKQIEKMLKDRKAAGDAISDEHIKAIEEQRDAVRCRPEEVVGSSTAPNLPVAFEQAELLAAEVLTELSHLLARFC